MTLGRCRLGNDRFHGVRRSEEIVGEAICEVVSEKPAGTVCRGYKEGIGRYTTMKDLIGYCGLDCETCGAYIGTVNDDHALREKTAKLWAELSNVSILPEHINC